MITVGIDEVGRGCWAGPLVAGAVILNEPIESLADSKVLTKLQRDRLNGQILQQAVAVGLGWIWSHEIDRDGLTTSVRRAMEMALHQIHKDYDEVVVDGNLNYLAAYPGTRALVKADASVPAVSAASIVAKVARDAYMMTVAAHRYPMYGFDKHVGYGTALHVKRLEEYGVTPMHRRSYKPIQKIMLLSNT